MSLPILRLRLAGNCASFAEGLCGTDDESETQNAACSLQSVPIKWYRKVREKKKKKMQQNFTESSHPCELIKEKGEVKITMSPQSVIPPSNKVRSGKEIEEEEEDTSRCFYESIEAMMSVCDTESGPAIEIKAHGPHLSLFMRKYDIIDENPEFDVVSKFAMDTLTPDNDHYLFERIIPLKNIDHASPGHTFDFENILHTSRGICDCAVKVYGLPSEQTFLGNNKKLLLFDLIKDVKKGKEMDRHKVIDYLNTLIIWNREQISLASQVYDDEDGTKGETVGKNKVADLIRPFCC